MTVVEDLFRRRQPLPTMDAIYYIQPSKEKYDLFLKMHSLHNHHVFDFVTKRENCVLTLYMILNVLFELTVKI